MRKNTPKKKTDGIITTKRKTAARNMRTTSRSNEGGSKSNHVMEWGEGPGKGRKKYTVNPTIFPEKDGSWTDLGKSSDRGAAVKEASKRGEVIGFKSAKKAEKFAAGSWKKGQDKKDAMKNYRADKKDKALYTQSKEFKASKKSNKGK